MPNPGTMGVLRAFLEAFRLLRTNVKPMISSMLLVLVPCDLLSSLAQHYLPPLLVLDPNLLLHETLPSLPNKVEVEPVSTIISGLKLVVMPYLSIMACSGNKPSPDALLRRARRTWWRPAITVVLYAWPFWLLAPLVPLVFVKIVSPILVVIGYVPDWMLLLIGLMLVFGMPACIAVLNLVERWGLVASVQEEGCYGIKAFGRAWGFMKERKLQVLVLTLAMLPLEIGISMACSFAKVDGREEMTLAMLVTRSLVGALVRNPWRIYDWLVHTAFYYHQRNYWNRE